MGQIPICWDPSVDAAVQRAHEQFRWFGGGWEVNADLPTPMGFSGAPHSKIKVSPARSGSANLPKLPRKLPGDNTTSQPIQTW